MFSFTPNVVYTPIAYRSIDFTEPLLIIDEQLYMCNLLNSSVSDRDIVDNDHIIIFDTAICILELHFVAVGLISLSISAVHVDRH